MADCNVCIDSGYDGDPAECFERRVITARKQHRCYECKRPIPAGTSYEKTTGKWDGEFDTFVVCLDCVSIRDGFACGGGSMIGCLWEDIYEQVFPEMTTGCLQKISEPSAKAYLIERWQKWKGLA